MLIYKIIHNENPQEDSMIFSNSLSLLFKYFFESRLKQSLVYFYVEIKNIREFFLSLTFWRKPLISSKLCQNNLLNKVICRSINWVKPRVYFCFSFFKIPKAFLLYIFPRFWPKVETKEIVYFIFSFFPSSQNESFKNSSYSNLKCFFRNFHIIFI